MLDGLDTASSEMEEAKVCLSLSLSLCLKLNSEDMKRMKACSVTRLKHQSIIRSDMRSIRSQMHLLMF